MAKSSYAVALLLAGWGGEAAAQSPADPVTADTAMKNYREWLKPVQGCPASGPLSDQEIVVCGRTHRQPERSPLPVQRDPGEIVRHAGEPGGGPVAMAGPACSHSCYEPAKINVIQAIIVAPKIIRHILHGDD